MILDFSDHSLATYKALGDQTRLLILRTLGHGPRSVTQLADSCGISKSIVVRHLKQLGEANLIFFTKNGRNKVANLVTQDIAIDVPDPGKKHMIIDKIEIPVGMFSKFDVKPTCGLADADGYIGITDDARSFNDFKRSRAQIVWFSKGYVEYTIPNYLTDRKNIKMISLNAELGSEFPTSNSNWPSDISFELDGHYLGFWKSKGDFADVRGKFTPRWTSKEFNQYGTYITIIITEVGTYISGKQISDLTIQQLLPLPENIRLRIGVDPRAPYQGGCTIFGKGFGNYNKEMSLVVYSD